VESERNSKLGAGMPSEGQTGVWKEDNAPSWKGLIVSVLAAMVLSVAATLLLGGVGGLTGRAGSGRCGNVACGPGARDAGIDEKVFRDETNGALAPNGTFRSAGASGAVGRTPAGKISPEGRRDR